MSAITLPIEQKLGLVAWAALAILQLIWHGWLLPSQSMPMALVLAITLIPLLLPLAALRQPRRALLWIGILALFYFCHGVAEAWSAPAERALAVAEIALTLLLIGTLGAGVRRPRR
jgi:Predicted membrane protein